MPRPATASSAVSRPVRVSGAAYAWLERAATEQGLSIQALAQKMLDSAIAATSAPLAPSRTASATIQPAEPTTTSSASPAVERMLGEIQALQAQMLDRLEAAETLLARQAEVIRQLVIPGELP